MKFCCIYTLEKRGKSATSCPMQLSVTLKQALVVALLLFANPMTVQAQESLASVERELPAFSLSGVDGKEWTANSLSGKVWVVNFWATWCPPCIEEIPSMNKAWDILEPEGIGMLAINAGEDRAAVEEFLVKVPIDFPTLLGNMDSMPNWSARALPTTLVIDKSGKVVFEALGPREWDDAELLQKIIDLQ